VPTDAGRKALRAAAPVYLRGIGDLCTAHLTGAELAAVRKGLSRVLQAAESGR
jgi:DNA-binding MarR family transcriptional regulator